MATFMSITDISLIVACFSLAVYGYTRRATLPLPPGPRRYPIIGSLLSMPKTFQWETFMRWGEETGSDVVYAETIGVKFIILNSVDAANDLLTKRSLIYSSRPQFPMIIDLMGWEFLFSLLPYGEKWRARRRLFQHHYPATRHDHYQPTIKRFVRTLQSGLLESPENFYEHLQHMTGGFALALGYGIKIKPFNDPYVSFSRETLGKAAEAGVPGRYLVDIVPLLKHVPEWMPGAGFKRQAKIWYKEAQEFRNRPFRDGERELAAGTGTPSFLSMCMDDLHESKDKESELDAIKDAASMFYSGGSDTSLAAIYTFALLMTRFPEIQRKARQEIDSVIGHHQAPSFEDKDNLPYLTAVLMEVLRYHPPVPIGVPHFLEEDDEYRGYYMPKGSMVVGNCWAMVRNEADYPNANTFNPERFLKDGKLDASVRDPRTIVFGFGRRICPGLHIAWSIFWYTSVSLLSMFEIVKKKDEHGVDIEPIEEYESGLISPLLEFDCELKLRFPKESFASVING
ncbi:cytochrome P450 [Cyathus striatus]|nr:cytochrome P450 [Cyathus striatus]